MTAQKSETGSSIDNKQRELYGKGKECWNALQGQCWCCFVLSARSMSLVFCPVDDILIGLWCLIPYVFDPPDVYTSKHAGDST